MKELYTRSEVFAALTKAATKAAAAGDRYQSAYAGVLIAARALGATDEEVRQIAEAKSLPPR